VKPRKLPCGQCRNLFAPTVRQRIRYIGGALIYCSATCTIAAHRRATAKWWHEKGAGYQRARRRKLKREAAKERKAAS
jgi:hypothetical protein